ncbi:MAG: hypothetical protein AAFY15_06645 [Cyanobacteria bacterium J06648_11]
MTTRDRVYDCAVAEELPDGTVRYWTVDPRQAERDVMDARFNAPPHSGTWRSRLQVFGRVLWAIAKMTAIACWLLLKLIWKGVWVLFFVFCIQGIIGGAIAMSRQ